MPYNVVIQDFKRYFLLALREDELARAVHAHDHGADKLSIPGERVIPLTAFKQMRIFQSWNGMDRAGVEHFLNSHAAGLGSRYWKIEDLLQIGSEVTKEWLNCGFGEKKTASGLTATVASDPGIWDRLHPEVAAVSRKLYEDGSFKESAQAALTEVDARVRAEYRTVHNDGKTGAPMMAKAFAKVDPVFRLFPQTDQDHEIKQEGYMHIFMGTMMALRNPKSHSNFKIEEQDAIELLFLASRLLRKLDEAVK